MSTLRIQFGLADTMPQLCSDAEFDRENRESLDEEELRAVRHLKVGHSINLCGGAAPVVIVTRVA